MKKIIISVLITVALIFIGKFAYEMYTFAQGVKHDLENNIPAVDNSTHPSDMVLKEKLSFKNNSTQIDLKLISKEKIEVNYQSKLDTFHFDMSFGVFLDLDSLYIDNWEYKKNDVVLVLYSNNIDSVELIHNTDSLMYYKLLNN